MLFLAVFTHVFADMLSTRTDIDKINDPQKVPEMTYISILTTKLSNLRKVDQKPEKITENMDYKRDQLGKYTCYEALNEWISRSLNVYREDGITILDALANKKQIYVKIKFNMDESAGSDHLVKDQGEPNGDLSYIATADFYINRPTIYNITQTSSDGKPVIDEWRFDPKNINDGGEYYLPYIVRVFTNLHNGVTKACLYRINTNTMSQDNVEYSLYKEDYIFSTNIVPGGINIKQYNDDDTSGNAFFNQFKPTSSGFNRLKSTVRDCIQIPLVQDIDTPLDKRIVQVSDDTLVDANFVCPFTISSENLSKIMGTHIRVRNQILFKKDTKPVDIYKGDTLVSSVIRKVYKDLSYAWYLHWHFISDDVPDKFNAKHINRYGHVGNSSYYKEWQIDGEVIMKVDMTATRKKYQDKYDVGLKNKFGVIKFENIGGYISWYKDECVIDYNQTDIFFDTQDIVSVCDKSCYRSLFTDDAGLDKFFKFYYPTLTNDVKFSHNVLMTLIALDQEYEQPGFDQLIKFFKKDGTMKKKLLNAMIFSPKAIDLMIWLELINKGVEAEAIELTAAYPAYEELSESFIENIKKNKYKAAAKSFYGLLNLITDNAINVPEDLCEEPIFDDKFFRRFDFENDFKLMFNVLFENPPKYGIATRYQKSINVDETYKELKLTLEETHDFCSLFECFIKKSKITDAFDAFDCLKDLNLHQKQFIYRVLCDYY